MSESKKEEILEIIWEDILKMLKGKKPRRRPTDLWIQRFYAFKCFVSQHKKYPLSQDSAELAGWVIEQRCQKKNGKLSQVSLEILTQYGFVWQGYLEQLWNSRYEELKRHLKKHKAYPKERNSKELVCWVSNQRTSKSKGKILKEREDKLNAIGFIWDTQEAVLTQWSEVFSRYKAFIEKQGCFPSIHTNRYLYDWASKMRAKKKKGKLSKQQLELLDEINFIWDFQHGVIDKNWNEKYDELKTFIEVHDTFPTWGNKAHRGLFKWYYVQKNRLNKGKSSIDRQQKLEDLGWITTRDLKWEKNYKLLSDHMKNQKYVPLSKVNRPLNLWVIKQRKFKKLNTLPPEREAKLKAIGFFGLKNQVWENRFYEYSDWMEEHNEFPTTVTNPPLYGWCTKQRIARALGKMTKEQEELLSKKGFIWNLSDSEWDKKYEELIQWLKKHKKLPKHKTQPSLYKWFIEHRKRKKEGRLSKNQELRLDQVIELEKKYQI